MKTVILALLVLVVVSQGEALKCICKGTSCRETCRRSNEVCAHLIFVNGFKVTSIVGCMDAGSCSMLRSTATRGTCCNQDLCNAVVK